MNMTFLDAITVCLCIAYPVGTLMSMGMAIAWAKRGK